MQDVKEIENLLLANIKIFYLSFNQLLRHFAEASYPIQKEDIIRAPSSLLAISTVYKKILGYVE